MRGNTRGRRKKYHINYKKTAIALLLVVIISILAIFGIRKITTPNTQTGDSNLNSSNVEEKVVPEDITIKLVATGDIMCHSTNFKAAYNSQTKEYDFSPVFVNVAKYISDADIAIRKFRNNICRRSKRI